MKDKKLKRTLIFFAAFFLAVAILYVRYQYYEIYLLDFDGRVESYSFDEKKMMTIKVSGEEHNIGHSWPILQGKIEVGDSVIKNSKEYNIILYENETGEKIVCAYK